MKCTDVRDHLVEENKPKAAVDAHLEECGDCRTWNDTWHEASKALKTLDAPPLPPDFAHTVALRAAGERGNLKQGAARLGDRLLTLILGRDESYAGSPLSLTLLWGILVATFAAASMTLSLYLTQSLLKTAIKCNMFISGAAPARSILWLPGLVEMNWRQGYLFSFILFFAGGILIFHFAARALNLRGLLNAVRSGRRLPAFPVVLSMAGLFGALLLWNFLIYAGDAMARYPEQPWNFNHIGTPYFYSYPHHSPLGMLLLLLNPFHTSFPGLVFCGITFLLLFTRCTRGVPSLVLSFYGCLGAAALMPLLSGSGISSWIYYLWAMGTLGVVNIKAFCIFFISMAGLAGLAAGILFSLTRFDEGLPMSKRLYPALSLFFGAALALVIPFMPLVTKVIPLQHEMINAALPLQTGRGVKAIDHTIVSFTREHTAATLKRTGKSPGNLYGYHFFSRDLENERIYREMKAVAEGPVQSGSFIAHRFLAARSLAHWDGPAVMEAFVNRTRSCFSDRYGMAISHHFYNGMTREETRKLLEKLGDPGLFTQSDYLRRHLARAYQAIGEHEKSRSMASGISYPANRAAAINELQTISRGFDGSVKGRIKINGKTARGLQLRLISSDNLFPYINHGARAGSMTEEEFLHYLENLVPRESSFFSCPDSSSLASRSLSMRDWNRLLPLIVTRTDNNGAFCFSNLAPGQYCLVARFPEKLKSAVPKNPPGIMELKEGAMSRDLGTLELDTTEKEAAHE